MFIVTFTRKNSEKDPYILALTERMVVVRFVTTLEGNKV